LVVEGVEQLGIPDLGVVSRERRRRLGPQDLHVQPFLGEQPLVPRDEPVEPEHGLRALDRDRLLARRRVAAHLVSSSSGLCRPLPWSASSRGQATHYAGAPVLWWAPSWPPERAPRALDRRAGSSCGREA